MNDSNIKQVIEIPQQAWEEVITSLADMRQKVSEMKDVLSMLNVDDVWLPKDEFMNRIGIKKSMYAQKFGSREGQIHLRTKKVGRKVFIHLSEVSHYLST